MKISFKKLTIDNFSSIGHAELDLKDKGIMLVRGINNEDPLSDSNGSGKSALTTDSILWCLTGEMNKPTKQIDNFLIPESIAKVKLEFDIDKDAYVVERINDKTKTLNIIKNGQDLSGNTYTKSKDILNTELRFLNKEVITSLIVLGQGLEGRFSKLKATERKSRLEYLVGMDTLLEKIQENIDKADKEITKNITDIELKIAEQEAIISSSQKIIDSYNDIKPISEQEYNAVRSEYDSLSTSLEEIRKRISDLNDINNKRFKEKDTINSQTIELNNNLLSYKNKLSESELKLTQLENLKIKSQTELDKAAASECPLCHQHLPNKDLENQLRENLKEVEQDIKSIEADFNKSELETKIRELEEFLFVKKQENTALQNQINETQTNIQQQEKELNDNILKHNKQQELLKQYDSYKTESESKQKLIDTTQKAIDEANKTIELLRTQLVKLNKDKDINKFFKSQASRKFRNFLLNGVFTYLNERLKYYSSKLFTGSPIKISNNGNDIEIKVGQKFFESLSGGEGRRADICIQCALRDLARTQKGMSCDFIVLDEVFDYLDAKGVEETTKFIEEEIKDVTTTFITTHIQNATISYDGLIEVTKDDAGISIVTEK